MQKVVNPKSTFRRDVDWSCPKGKPAAFFTLDVETCGTDPELPVIEVGMAYVVKGRVKDTFRFFVAPGMPVPRHIVELTGITAEMLAGAPRPDEVARAMAEFVGTERHPIFAHNAAFDASFLYCHGMFDYIAADCHICDTYRLARERLPHQRSYSLPKLVKSLGIAAEGSHRALADAVALADVVNLCYGDGEYKAGSADPAFKDGRPACPRCGESRLMKDGKQRGQQRYKCGSCGLRTVNPNGEKRGVQPIEDNRPACPKCGENRLVRDGMQNGRQRYSCGACGRRTVFPDPKKSAARPAEYPEGERPACPNCGGTELTKDGIKNGRQRYVCKTCNRKTVCPAYA